MNKLRLAACGLDCNECGVYKVVHDRNTAESLISWYRKNGWIDKNDDVYTVVKKDLFCMGCWNEAGVRWCSDCRVKRCCEAKHLNHCGECNGFPCAEYKNWAEECEHNKYGMVNLMCLRSSSRVS